MANYDLYTELHLDKDMPPQGIAEILDSRLADLRGRGFSSDSPEVDQFETARAILGDPYKRDIYEAALYGPHDDIVNIRWLHELADSRPPRTEYEPSAATTRQHAPLGYDDVDSSADSNADADRDADVDAGADTGLTPDPEATRVTPVVEDSPVDVPAFDSETDAEADSVADTAAEPQVDAGDEAKDDEPRPEPVARNSWELPAQGAPQPGPSAPSAPSASAGRAGAPSGGGRRRQEPSAQLDTSRWGVGGRRRSESKLYVALLVVIAVGMIYPLFVVFSAGLDDVDSFVRILRAGLFAIAHVALWTSINEIIWGVRRIVAPDTSDDSRAAR